MGDMGDVLDEDYSICAGCGGKMRRVFGRCSSCVNSETRGETLGTEVNHSWCKTCPEYACAACVKTGDRLVIPPGSAERKNIPLTTGLIDYFPAALAYVARISKAGNDKHNPGQPLHHARGKSNDHADCISRHLADRGLVDPEDNLRHSGKLAWRALALLQQELEEQEGAPLPRGAKI